MREAHVFTENPQAFEFGRVHISLHGQVMFAGLQVLPEGEHVDIMLAQVGHHSLDFADFLTQSEHEAGLGRDLRIAFLEALQ